MNPSTEILATTLIQPDNELPITKFDPPLDISNDDESHSDASDAAVTTDRADECLLPPPSHLADDDLNTAPMHLHALRISPRLIGSPNIANIPRIPSHSDIKSPLPTETLRGNRSRSTSRSRPRSSSGIMVCGSNASSRSSSPVSNLTFLSCGENGKESGTLDSSNVYFDPDLLLDRLGFFDLEIRCGPFEGKFASSYSGGLTSVNERLSEATLEDSHAFQDLGYGSTATSCASASGAGAVSMPSVTHTCSLSGFGSNISMGSVSVGHSWEGSIAGGSVLGEDSVLGLGRLDEEDEDEDDLGIEDEGDEKNK